MNREVREHYQVVIQAKDMAGQMGGLSGTTTVNITLLDINNNPPRFPQGETHRSCMDTMTPLCSDDAACVHILATRQYMLMLL